MGIIDKKGNLFGKINIVDLSVLVIVIAILIAGVYRFTAGRAMPGVTPQKMVVTILAREVPNNQLVEFKEGLAVRRYNSDELFGKITGIKVEPATRVVETDGKLINAEVPGYSDITMKVESFGHANDEEIIIAGEKVKIRNENVTMDASKIGDFFYFTTDRIIQRVYVIDIEY